MRGRLVIAVGALTMALTSGVAWGAQDDGGQATGSHRTKPPVSHKHPRAHEGVPGYQRVTLPNANVPNFQRRTVHCPPGKKVLGGGAEARGDTAILVGSFPTDDGTGWIGLGRQTATDNVGISVFVICANV
ncbi:hypothetical protein [Streptomyces coffeae]|uniref:Secreted protein n=1 Tax=Streptomyces coffeae TaxID=621382 RepID=A0ABS1N7U9_9ACTN|nr:hypothetical protein [Streptomyces coffeae]MBL1096009.1 hypothetical protein [Streptomyces coffeae]